MISFLSIFCAALLFISSCQPSYSGPSEYSGPKWLVLLSSLALLLYREISQEAMQIQQHRETITTELLRRRRLQVQQSGIVSSAVNLRESQNFGLVARITDHPQGNPEFLVEKSHFLFPFPGRKATISWKIPDIKRGFAVRLAAFVSRMKNNPQFYEKINNPQFFDHMGCR